MGVPPGRVPTVRRARGTPCEPMAAHVPAPFTGRHRGRLSAAPMARRKTLRIATFNVNGIRPRLPHLLEWLEKEKPDVACLQELKATDAQFPKEAIEAAGYGALWVGQTSWNGVAVLTRDAE